MRRKAWVCCRPAWFPSRPGWFVASRRGRHFYSIGAPEAILIRARDLIGYPTAEAAIADGKIPAAQ